MQKASFFFLFLSLASLSLGSSCDSSGDNIISVLVELELDDADVPGADSDLGGSSVGLVLGDAIDINPVLLSVNGQNLSFFSLVRSDNDANFVILADWEGADLLCVYLRFGIGRLA